MTKLLTHEQAIDLLASAPSIDGQRYPLVEFVEEQQREIERLRNIANGCPVCAELAANIRTDVEPTLTQRLRDAGFERIKRDLPNDDVE